MGLRTLLEVARRTKLRIDPRIDTYRIPPWRPAPKGPYRIGIVGAGISGLVAAKLLADLGFQVTVLEAQDRPGGRMLSLALQELNSASDRVEAGAARISDQHRHALYWLERCGFVLAPFYPLRGRLVRLGDNSRQLGRNVSNLSSHTVHHLVTGHLPWESQFTETSGSLVSGAITKPCWLRVIGGAAQLAEALADELGRAVRYAAPVQRIIADGDKIAIQCRGTAEERFHRVVLAAPLTTYQEIDFVPALSETKRSLVASCSSQPSLRVFVTCRSGWQEDNRVNGWGCTESGMEIWCQTTSNGQLEVVTVYAQGECARHLVAQNKQSREREITEMLDKAFTGIRLHIRSIDSYCWDDNRWAKGAQTAERPKHHDLARLKQPEGALHFAGESTCEEGWIDGAIASAYRVVGEINEWANHQSGTTARRTQQAPGSTGTAETSSRI